MSVKMTREKIIRVGQNYTFIGIYGNFGRELTIHTVIYGVYIQFWPTLKIIDIVRCACPPTDVCASVFQKRIYKPLYDLRGAFNDL